MENAMLIDRIMGPIWVFGWAIIIYLFHRERTKRDMHVYDLIHKERALAIEKGVPYPELPPYEEAGKSAPHRPISMRAVAAAGILLILAGCGVITSLLIIENRDLRQHWPFGLIPAFAGAGCLLIAWLNRSRDASR
jgi:hypothetical protein